MFGAADGVDRAAAERNRRWRDYVRYELTAYSDAHRRRLDPAALQTVDDLRRVPPLTLEDMGDPTGLMLHPDAQAIASRGSREMKARLAWAKATGRLARLERGLIDRTYKPVHWVLAGSTPIGYSHRDLGLLAEAGRLGLERAGVKVTDAIVSLLAPGPNLAYWQLILGAQRAGVSVIGLDPRTDPESVASLDPTVVVGSGPVLARLARSQTGTSLAAVIAVAAPGDDRVPAAGDFSDRVVLSHWFAPPGVRSLWAQCRGSDGLHFDPAIEIIHDDEGRLVWSALGWRGTAMVRLDTGLRGYLDRSPCPACNESTRIQLGERAPAAGPSPRPKATAAANPVAKPAAPKPAAPKPAAPKPAAAERVPRSAQAQPEPAGAVADEFAELDVDIETTLDNHPGVKAWQAELRTVSGYDELIVFLAPSAGGHPGPIVRDLDAELDVTQFVIVDAYDVAERIEDSGGQRVVDLRS